MTVFGSIQTSNTDSKTEKRNEQSDQIIVTMSLYTCIPYCNIYLRVFSLTEPSLRLELLVQRQRRRQGEEGPHRLLRLLRVLLQQQFQQQRGTDRRKGARGDDIQQRYGTKKRAFSVMQRCPVGFMVKASSNGSSSY